MIPKNKQKEFEEYTERQRNLLLEHHDRIINRILNKASELSEVKK
jgi:hypothetical protein